jgi:tRNA1Val (adenine37-N6)-methyltransferase
MSVFRFKQFNVSQIGCAMKVNTDGVLLGALVNGKAHKVLDIGTGTGVIALMLAQRFPSAKIDAVELDTAAAQTAESSFAGSPFAAKMRVFPQSFQDYFLFNEGLKYDLIVSNPPFYIQSLPSPGAGKAMAKHAGDGFFLELINECATHLHEEGSLWLILPTDTAALVKQIAADEQLFVRKIIYVQSYSNTEPHREILELVLQQTEITSDRLVIYQEPKVYSDAYTNLLKDFLTIF